MAAGGACALPPSEPRARLFTLFDLVAAAEAGTSVAQTDSLPAGFMGAKFVTPGGAEDDDRLNPGQGYVDGQPATWVTTELWANFDEVWVQPLYRATKGGVVIEDPQSRAPWVFGVGPQSLFYSPFWEVYGFEVPDGTDVGSILDTRAVIEMGNRNGGFKSLGRRITSLAPGNVLGPAQGVPYDDTAAWDGAGSHRFIDFGDGGFDFDEANVVRETPFFIFARRGDGHGFQPLGFPGVGGTRPLFSAAPTLSAGAASVSAVSATAPVRPSFGGLWRIYWVETFNATMAADGRVNDCWPSDVCVTLDSQSAIEALGADRIFASEILTATPLLQLGSATFSKGGTYVKDSP